MAHTHEVIGEIERVTSGVAEGESAVRGFAITRDPAFIEQVEPAISMTTDAISRLRLLTADNPQQLQRLDRLTRTVDQRISMLRDYGAFVRANGSPGVPPKARGLSLEIGFEADQMLATERGLLEARARETHDRTNATVNASVTVTSFACLLIFVTMFLLDRELRRRQSAEDELALLLHAGELLQACRNLDEAFEIVRKVVPRFFPECSGAVSIVHASRDVAEVRARWGSDETFVDGGCFEMGDCWALRRGQPVAFDSAHADAMCKHFGERAPGAALCVPLTAHGEAIGVLHVTCTSALDKRRNGVASVVSEQLGLAIANLQLRETLHGQSIRDPLTGLFNRRYTEETAERELARAARNREPLSIIMIDVDHFKRFNDTFGHEGGDIILQAIAASLKSMTRLGDVASRLGGEELSLLMPGAGIDAALEKAERIRQAVAELHAVHAGGSLGQVSISLGVAEFPTHGERRDELFRAADKALYAAKHSGRNRVCAASITPR